MTVTELAKELNTTTMTVYRRLKRAGVNIADLRDADTNELTSEGVSTIGQLFHGTGVSQPVTDATMDGATRTQPDTKQDVQPVEVEAAVLRVKLEAVQAMLEAVTDERDRLRQQVDGLTRMLEAEQRQRTLLLTDGGHQRRGLFGWFRRGRGTPPQGEYGRPDQQGE